MRTRICEAKFGALSLHEGDAFRCVAICMTLRRHLASSQNSAAADPADAGATISDASSRTKTVVHIADLAADRACIATHAVARLARRRRTLVGVPMLRKTS